MLPTGNFCPTLVALPGGLAPSELFALPPVSPRGAVAPSLLSLIKMEFNKRFSQNLERKQKFRWTDFEVLQRALATGNFWPALVALSGGLAWAERFSLPSAALMGAAATAAPHYTPPSPPAAASVQATAGGRTKLVDGPTTTGWAMVPDIL